VNKLAGKADSSFNKIQEGFKGATAIDVVDIHTFPSASNTNELMDLV
jgi:hypothetical protein